MKLLLSRGGWVATEIKFQMSPICRIPFSAVRCITGFVELLEIAVQGQRELIDAFVKHEPSGSKQLTSLKMSVENECKSYFHFL